MVLMDGSVLAIEDESMDGSVLAIEDESVVPAASGTAIEDQKKKTF